MKAIVLATLFVTLLAVTWGRPEEQYTSEFDDIDEEAVLASPRLVQNYINCAKTGEHCTPDGKKFRELIPDALKTKCAKCTETQRTKSLKILKWIVANRPNDFLDLEKDFDKEHAYRTEWKDVLEKENIALPPLKA